MAVVDVEFVADGVVRYVHQSMHWFVFADAAGRHVAVDEADATEVSVCDVDND